MTLGHAAPLAATLILASLTGAAAQFQPPAQQQPPCFSEFMPLRDETEKRGLAIQAASKRKASAQEVCPLFRKFAEAEGKLLKYAEANATWCGIPAQAVTEMKTNHARTLKIRTQVCTAAAAPPPRPRGPSLGDALGTTRVPTPSTTRRGRGTYDTLTGGPVTR